MQVGCEGNDLHHEGNLRLIDVDRRFWFFLSRSHNGCVIAMGKSDFGRGSERDSDSNARYVLQV
jgi:hypothetical protein